MDQYRFQKFERVERWVTMALLTFLYLEWYRACQLRRRDLRKKEKQWWERQRTYGLCQAVRQQTERAELKYLADRLKTPGGIRRLRRELENAYPSEYRNPA